ncbi:MAG: leucine-rich repeat protein [Kiritimatiellae bacterium]|nr:leucine-rich repeat protein [Kiritimatiellia bacterium]
MTFKLGVSESDWMGKDPEFPPHCYLRSVSGSATAVSNLVIPHIVMWDKHASQQYIPVNPGAGPVPLVSIQSSAFQNWSLVHEVTLSRGITGVGVPAFRGCNNLRAIHAGVGGDGDPFRWNEAGDYASSNGVLYKLTSSKTLALVKYPEGKTGKYFVLPESVTSLQAGCLAGTKLRAVRFLGKKPSCGSGVFTGSSLVGFCPESWGLEWGQTWQGIEMFPIPAKGKKVEYGVTNLYKIADGVLYGFEANGKNATINDMAGAKGNVAIPSKLGGYTVTSIRGGAFYGCKGMTGLTIPASVTKIDEYYGFPDGLENISVDSGNAKYASEGGVLLSKNKRTLLLCPPGKKGAYAIPSGVANIGDNAFDNCSGLTGVTIPGSVTSIGNYAFSQCSGLTDVAIPASVKSIGSGAFTYCTGLTNVNIPSSVTNIGAGAFSRCSELETVTIAAGVKSIGSGAFTYCTGLTNVNIPSSVTNIGAGAFSRCSGLTDIAVAPGNATFASVDGVLFSKNKQKLLCFPGGKKGTYAIPDGVTAIGDEAFSACSGLKTVAIPGSVKTIGNYAFDGSGLTNASIGKGVAIIGFAAFRGCGLKALTLPDGVTDIGGEAFDGMESGSVEIPDSVMHLGEEAFPFADSKTVPGIRLVDGWVVGRTGALPADLKLSGIRGIADGAFRECGKLKTVAISANRSIGADAFYGCKGLTTVKIGNGVKEIGWNAFRDCSNLASVKIGGGVTNIDGHAFAYCMKLKAVAVPGSVKRIGESAFDHCIRLTSATLGKGVEAIGDGAFVDCHYLASVAIPGSVKEIGSGAFACCTSLKSVTIPRSVTYIGTGAFYGCLALACIAVAPGNAKYASVDGVLFSKDKRTLLCVPGGKKGVYGIPNGVTRIAERALHGCDGLRTVTIPASVKSIGEDAFSCSENLTGVAIPGSVKNIGDEAFNCCFSLENAKIGYGVANIGARAFSRCALKTVAIPASVTDIAADAFEDCNKLQTLHLPSTLKGKKLKVAKGCKIVYTEACAVSFDANGGTGTMAKQGLPRNETAKLSANRFKRDGFVFIGWAKTKTGPVAHADRAAVKKLAGNGKTVALYAKWAKATYAVAFDANGGKGTMAAQKMKYGKAAKLRANAFERTGYSFQGWAKTAAGKVAYKNAQAVKNLRTDGKTTTLYAKWKARPYKVAFDANGGTGTMAAQTLTWGKAAKLRKNAFKRSGCLFLGWAEGKSGPVAYQNAQAVKNLRSDGKIVTLYAKWAKKSYKVAFDANGGTGSMAVQGMTYGTAADLRKNAFKRAGCVFAGWAKTPTGTVAYTDRQAVKNLRTDGGTTTLYAVWRPDVLVTASGGNDAGAVVDGDETTSWTPGTADGSWVVLTLSSLCTVEDVEVIGENLPEGTRFLLSEDADDWQEGVPGKAQYVWIAFPAGDVPPVVREIRVLPEK